MTSKPRNSSAAAPHRVRIVGGRWKRTPLDVADIPGLRPTPERVRETLFNWLGHDLRGRSCLDLFAGTGALGLEAASRGAEPVVCVERDRQACRGIRRTVDKLEAHGLVSVREDDAERAARSFIAQARRFDLVLLDPPFHAGWLPRVLPLAARLLNDDGDLYVEAEAELDAALVASSGLAVRRRGHAGQVHYHVLSRSNDAPDDPAPLPRSTTE